MNFFFFVFAGTRVKYETLSEGHFHCPHCGTTRAYQRALAASYIHLFWIPLIRLKELGEVLRCRTCGGSFASEEPGGVSGRAADRWTCERCGNVNPPGEIGCLKCGKGRSA